MKKWIALGGLVAILAILAAAAPATPALYEAPVPEAERAHNAAILAALAAVNIERAWVDSAADPVLVVYERPDGIPLEVAQAYALASAAFVVPGASEVEARTDGITWVIRTDLVLAYQRGEIERAELEAAIVKR